MLGSQDAATGAVLMFGGAGAFMGRILAVRTAAGAVRTVVSLVTFSVTVVTGNRARGGYGLVGVRG